MGRPQADQARQYTAAPYAGALTGAGHPRRLKLILPINTQNRAQPWLIAPGLRPVLSLRPLFQGRLSVLEKRGLRHKENPETA